MAIWRETHSKRSQARINSLSDNWGAPMCLVIIRGIPSSRSLYM